MNNKNLHRKLNKALKDLDNKGYFTAKNFWCCSTCGWGAIDDDKKDRAVFYHAQDAENLRDNGTLYLSWSGSGEEIVSTLTSRGLFSHWDGDENKRIFLAESKPDKLPEEIQDSLIKMNFENEKNSIKGLNSEEKHLLSILLENAKQDGIQFVSGESHHPQPEKDIFVKNKIEEYRVKLSLTDKESEKTFVWLIEVSIMDGILAGLKNKRNAMIEADLEKIFG